MIIGLNTLFLIPNEVGGSEYYTRSTINNLLKVDKKNHYILFCNKENIETFRFKTTSITKVLVPINAKNRFVRIFTENLIFPLIVKKYNCKILHSFGYSSPLWGKFKKLITIYDLNWKDHPEDNSIITNMVLNYLISNSIKKADRIVTTSNFSKNRLIKYFPKFRNKVIVIRAVIDNKFLKILSTKLNPPMSKKYILCVSAFYPHKMIIYLIKLWKKFTKTNKNLTLVIIGQHGKDQSLIEKQIATIDNIKWFKKISLKELVAFYKYSKLVIQPSVYEGFGYPVYEAIACGKNVLVGKKELYHSSILEHLNKLSFNIVKDVKLLKSLSNNRKPIKTDMYNQNDLLSTKKIINLYSNI